MYYPCSKNKGADQLRGYREADLRLVFTYAKSQFSHNEAHISILLEKHLHWTIKIVSYSTTFDTYIIKNAAYVIYAATLRQLALTMSSKEEFMVLVEVKEQCFMFHKFSLSI